jgi:hypothetical protein
MEAMSMFKIVHDSGWPFVGYTFNDDGNLYCKTCGADSKLEHSIVCPQVGHWPTCKRIRAANGKDETHDD